MVDQHCAWQTLIHICKRFITLQAFHASLTFKSWYCKVMSVRIRDKCIILTGRVSAENDLIFFLTLENIYPPCGLILLHQSTWYFCLLVYDITRYGCEILRMTQCGYKKNLVDLWFPFAGRNQSTQIILQLWLLF